MTENNVDITTTSKQQKCEYLIKRNQKLMETSYKCEEVIKYVVPNKKIGSSF